MRFSLFFSFLFLDAEVIGGRGSDGAPAMLDFERELMPDRYKKRNVSAIRHFPKGCGRNAPPIERVLTEDVSGRASSNVVSSGGFEKGKYLTPETLAANATGEMDAVQTSRKEHEETPGHSESLELEKMDIYHADERKEALYSPRKTMHSEMAELAPGKMFRPEPYRLQGSSSSSQLGKAYNSSMVENHMEKVDLSRGGAASSFVMEEVTDEGRLGSLEHLNDSSASPNCLVSPEHGGIDNGVSRLYGPSKRRKALTIRHFPFGCGRNALHMTREECLKRSTAMDYKGVAYEDSNRKQSLTIAKAGKLKELKNFEEKVQDSPNQQLQVAIDGNFCRESWKNSAHRTAPCPTLMEESQDLLENDRDGGASFNFSEMSDDTSMVGKKDKLNSPICSESSHDIDLNTYRSSVDMLAFQSDSKQAIGEDKLGVTVLTDTDDEQWDNTSQNRGGEHETFHFNRETQSQPSEILGEEGAYVTGKLVKLGEEGDINNHSFELMESAEEGGARIAEFQEEVASMNTPTDMTVVQALMAAPYDPWRRRQKAGMVRENSKTSGIKLKKDVGIQKGQYMSAETSLMGRKKAKKQVRVSKKKFGSLGALLHRPQNKSAEEDVENSLVQGEEDEKALAIYRGTKDFSISLPPFGLSKSNLDASCNEDVPIRTRVRKALRLFQVLCRKLLQSEESTSKNRGQRIRIDLTAAKILKAENEFVNTGGPIVGSVPGVEVGDEFHYRAELSVVGLHRSYQGGIDYTRINNSLLALSVVAFVGHADEMDSSNFLIYSGSGGRASEGNKPPEDQKLERGNLGLRNCIESKSPVRVIRGFKEFGQDGKPRPLSTFTYDGLYFVEDYWQEKGSQGFYMYKFKLRRIPGQPEISLLEVMKSKRTAVRGLCIADISGGMEKIPISVVNTVDDERPMPFKYITKMIYPSWYEPTMPKGCDCTQKCTDSGNCSCAIKNGGEIPFNFNGAIVQAKPLVYECGPACKCPPTCHNRVSQNGIKIRLEIFKTQSMGWGVRTLTSVPSGSFICEYIGELIQDMEAEQRSNDEYLFDIGHNYDDHDIQDGSPALIPDSQAISLSNVVEHGGFTIDAAHYGNVGRFINHSCSPNLYAQNVLYDHDDKRMPHILFFAAENIPPLHELTYHYNYTIGQVRDSCGNVKTKPCHCGSHECVGRLY